MGSLRDLHRKPKIQPLTDKISDILGYMRAKIAEHCNEFIFLEQPSSMSVNAKSEGLENDIIVNIKWDIGDTRK
jgi:hypothetical protein